MRRPLGLAVAAVLGVAVFSSVGGCRRKKVPLVLPDHHATASSPCPVRKRRPGRPDPSAGGSCRSDEDCAGSSLGPLGSSGLGLNARCERVGMDVTNTCSSDDCMKDQDCGDHHVCECTDDDWSTNRCATGDCNTDADCGPGGECWRSVDCSRVGYYCHHPGDACRSDADCADGGPGARCLYALETKAWRCIHKQCPMR